jgi:hypothetical protein
MVSLNWCNHLLTFVHVDILNGTKNTVPPEWQTTHFCWPYHPLAITSDFSCYLESSHVSHVIPNALVTSRAIYNCTGRHMELCVPRGFPRIAETNSYPEVDQLSVHSDGYGSHSMQNRPKMNGQQTMIMIYIYTTCLVPTVWSFDTFMTRPHSKWTHYSSQLLRSIARQCHTPAKSRTSGGSFTNPCFGTWTSQLKSAIWSRA